MEIFIAIFYILVGLGVFAAEISDGDFVGSLWLAITWPTVFGFLISQNTK